MGSPMSIPLWLALGDVVILGKLVDMFLDADVDMLISDGNDDVEMTEEMSEDTAAE